ncbi:MAG: serpin family protein [Alphaproteobacteria bacterium]
MRDGEREVDYGQYLEPEVRNVIKLTLAFAKAVGQNQSDKSENLVVSPYNAVACLSMVAKGADTLTREEMAKTLFGTDGKGLDKAAGDYAAMNTKILDANKGQVELTTANGVWTNQDLVTLRDTFAQDLKKTFGAEISGEDYSDPATVDKINAWADKNTNGLIKEVLKQLDPNDAAVLASSLYFKGKWTNPFDVKLTEDKTFTSDGNVKSTTPTMHQDFAEDGAMRYQKGRDYEAVTLTYGEEKQEGREMRYPSMRIVLVCPTDDGVSARDWLATQADGKVPAWLSPYGGYQDAVGSIELPRMDIKQKHDLIPALKNMGIQQAFKEGAADFTRMVEAGGDRLFVSQVSHDIVFKTDEKGSEAAAVTVAKMSLECMRPDPVNVAVKLDRSFVFALQDVQTNAVLFIGAVNKPNNEMKAEQAPKAPTKKKKASSKPKSQKKHH